MYFKPCTSKTRHFYIFMCICWFPYHTYASRHIITFLDTVCIDISKYGACYNRRATFPKGRKII